MFAFFSLRTRSRKPYRLQTKVGLTDGKLYDRSDFALLPYREVNHPLSEIDFPFTLDAFPITFALKHAMHRVPQFRSYALKPLI